MTTVEFLSYLRSLNTSVWVEGDRLRCSAPSGVLTADLREKLAERKEEIIRLLSEIQNSAGASLRSILPAEPSDRLPLSFAQQRLWFLDRLDPGNVTYNIPLAVRLRGPLDVAALARSLSEIVRRHEALRTTFSLVEGEPTQVIRPSAPVPVPVIDLRQLDASAREAEARRLTEAEAARPFDLVQGPLFRVSLLRLEEGHHVALLTVHHIVSDEWSKGVLITELGELYNSFVAGRPSPLPELPIQYRDFARWQREWLKGAVLESQLSFWKRQLQGHPPVLELPTDRPRPPVQSLRGARQQFILPPDLSESLKALAAGEGATIFMVLLAAFKTLIYRYTGQRDIIVGAPIAGRTRPETEGLIGFFINTLVLRTDLSGDPTFRELLAKVREVCLGAYAHQDLPFEKLVEELQPERDTSRNPLFQVAFQVLNTPRGSLKLSDLVLEPLESGSKATKFDLTLSMIDTAQGLGGTLVYASELFDDATITRLLSHFQNLIEGIVSDPAQRLSALPLLKADEKRQLLSERNRAPARYAVHRCLHELFEERAERAPKDIALLFEDERLTYGELNRRANRLAHYLRRLGVGPEERVGIYMERSTEMVVAILGILKAGGAYVPMDTAYPKERLAFMLEDASMTVLLTQQRLLETIPPHASRVVCLDSEAEAIGGQSEENPANLTFGDNLAYIIYTSGSTGRPKGVLISHANVVRLFAATQSYFRFDEHDVWTLFHSYAFDFSVWELWGALLYGGRLIVVPYLTARTPEAFYELLRHEKVTVLNQTPSAFRQLLKTEAATQAAGQPFCPRVIIFGGEALEIQSLSPWFENHPDRDTRLVNMYGITETTVHVTYRPITSAEQGEAYRSLIGGPLPDLRMYILDEHLQPVPVGVAGELYIGGDGVARGYLRRPGLTAERFIPDPFSSEPGARLYRSGDLGRYLPDGDTEYGGRIDHQVKVRGYRIELGEVEAALLEQDSVHEAVVVIGEDTGGDKRLIAYVVPSEREQSAIINKLRESLKERLPDYMVPSVFVLMESLPLTEHGKVDRRALPAPERARSGVEIGYVAPRDLLELQLVNIWEEVLEIKPVGVRDNFFDIGGHSLLAVRLFALIQEKLNKTLPLAALFQKGTVEHLAQLLRQQEDAEGSNSPLVKIQPHGSKLPFFCVHPGSGEVLCYVPWSRYLGPEQPFYALQDPNLTSDEIGHMTLEEMAALYVEAVREVRPAGPYLLGGWSFGGHVAFEMAQQLKREGLEVPLLVVVDTVSPALIKRKFANVGEAELLAIMASGMTSDSGRDISQLTEALSPLSPEEQLKYVYDYLVEHRELTTLPEYTLAYVYRALQVFKNRIRVQQAYAPRVYGGRITLFKATQRRDESPALDPTLGWGEFSEEPVNVQLIPGNHATIALMPGAEVLCQRLREAIDLVG